MASDRPEFIFIDESGDPGGKLAGDRYYLAAVHLEEEALKAIRSHLVNLRYHHALGGGELKDWWAVNKGDPGDRRLRSCVKLLEKMTDEGEVKSSLVWVNKDRFEAEGGPYIGTGVRTFYFRNYVLKRLLRLHFKRFGWGDNMELVLDRYDLPAKEFSRLKNLLDQTLDTPPAYITPVNSLYVGAVQIADVYTKLAKLSHFGHYTDDMTTLCETLMSPLEIRWQPPKS